MSFIEKAIVTIVTIALIFMIPAALLTQAIHQTVLKPYSTTAYLEKTNLYDQMELWVQAAIREQIGQIQFDGVPSAVSQVFQDAVVTVVEKQVTADFIAEKAGRFEASIWDYILGHTDRLEPVPVPELRTAFSETVRLQLNHWSEQTGVPLNTLGTEAEREQLIGNLANHIPDSIDLTLIAGDSALPQTIETLKQKYEQQLFYRNVLYGATLVLLLIGIVIQRRPRAVLSWTGTVLIVGCALSLVPAVATLALHREVVDLLVSLAGIERSEGWMQMEQGIVRLVEVMAADVRGVLLVSSAITVGVGIVGVVVTRVLPKPLG